jgi:predicted component of type VI protein secretion system
LFIGRNSGQSQLVISDNSISKQHAHIRRAGGALVVVDRQSANGTAVNGRFGKPNEEMPLRSGDTLTLGEVKLLLAESSNVFAPPTLT